MKKIVSFLLLSMICIVFTSFMSKDNTTNNFLKKRIVEEKMMGTHKIKVLEVQFDSGIGVVKDLVTNETVRGIIENGKFIKVDGKGKFLADGPIDLCVSCVCEYCNCRFSTRPLSWNCIICPEISCQKKLWWDETYWVCQAGTCETFFCGPD